MYERPLDDQYVAVTLAPTVVVVQGRGPVLAAAAVSADHGAREVSSPMSSATKSTLPNMRRVGAIRVIMVFLPLVLIQLTPSLFA